MLTINQVTKKFGAFTALEEISCELANGVYGLLAPNGAGKTTLIKMLTTLLFPTKGEILYGGEDIVQMGERYRDILGYLPQQFGYYKNDTPVQYLHYIAALKGMERAQAAVKINELLSLVALESVKNKKMKKFSGGMIQRVGIAQAMLNDPEILILDEPTAGLDPKERVRFRNLLTRLARDRIIILSTHIVSDVELIANEILMIKDRRLLYKESVESLCGRLEGKVYETELSYEEAEALKDRYLILSEKQELGRLKVRFLYEAGEPDIVSSKVVPSLEDVFIYTYQDEVNLAGDEVYVGH
ncbi:ABC transporter ATP-binding protein [Paenibacillus sp. 453mf]|uniref:ABC transporter ATP-binding protein n=1 Tax=Paenibacillus sp. 453mf TaxID=1761874 RepID=UPI0008EA0ADA|nr:ABC transporter ATP-binding protein [Paenibacillus sp. 453mf]SFS57684.1 ABC-type multidrug transport system, ATPase component [Paenibacillus sp. 453mf]